MTIQNIKLSDKFHVWVAATNLTIEEINREIVLEAKQKLKTLDKSTLVAAINELYENKLNKKENLDLTDNDIIVKHILANSKIQVGSEENGNSIIEFYDDTNNLYRKFLFNHEDKKWYLENGEGILNEVLISSSTIDGNNNVILLKRLPDEEFNNYTGPEGSLSYNLVTKSVHVHDGFTKGGLSLEANGLTLDKVAVSETDGKPGYLFDKVSAGNGIQIMNTNINGESKVSIINEMYNEFINPIANAYVRRNNSNKAYEFITKDEIVKDLDLIKISSEKQSFNKYLFLEDNITVYTANIDEDDYVINFDTTKLSKLNTSVEFNLVLTSSGNFNIIFDNTVKWDNSESITSLEEGIYIYKIRTFNNGLYWLVKLDSYYPN